MRAIYLLPLLLLPTVDAAAYTPRAWGSCPTIAFASNPNVVLHTSEAAGMDLVDLIQLLAAMTDIHATLDQVGGSSVSIPSFTVSATPFVPGNWFGDPTPTIHVGFTNDPNAAIGAADWDVDTGTCAIDEAQITLQDALLVPWRWMEPAYYGEDYWDAEHSIATTWWFRISYMHELLHAFGLAHSNDSYSMMNYSDRPFANRSSGEQIRPLPDDVEFLRAFYPDAGSRYEVAVLDTWYKASTAGGSYPAANQYRLCKPSKGTLWAADDSEGYCASGGTINVCPGESLRVRFAAANYSTQQADLTARMYLSTDTVWGGDLLSPSTHAFSVSAEGSSKQGRNFTVPSTAAYDTDYNVIVRLSGTSNNVFVSDWSPMRGHIHIKTAASCP